MAVILHEGCETLFSSLADITVLGRCAISVLRCLCSAALPCSCVFLPQWPSCTSVLKLKIRRRPFPELSLAVWEQFITPDALPRLAAYWQKQIIFAWRTVGIKVPVSACPLALAHLCSTGHSPDAWCSLRLLVPAASLIQVLLQVSRMSVPLRAFPQLLPPNSQPEQHQDLLFLV